MAVMNHHGEDFMQLSWLHSKTAKIIIWTVILVFLLCGIYAYTHRSRVSVGKTSAHPLVKVEKMEKKDMMKRVVLSGDTVPRESVDISPKYAGRLEKVYVDLGDKVTKGDILISQDTKDISYSIAQNRAGSQEAAADAVESRASYDAGTLKAQSDYDNALSTFNRYDTLFQEGAVSRQERDDKYQAMMEARAALQNLTGQDVEGVPAVIASKEAAAEKAAYTVDSLESQKGDMTMYAPVSGTIGYRDAEAGEWAAAGQKLLTIVDNSALYLDCAVAEQDIGVLREGMDMDVSIDSLGETVKGRIIYISPDLDASTHSYKVRILLDGDGKDLRGGMFGRSTVMALERKNALYLPKEGVLENNGKKWAFLIDSSHKVKKVEVTTGLYNDDSIEILTGISEGDQAAVTNISKLKDGMTVDVEGTV